MSLATTIFSGGIIALTGIVGIGKTTALRRMQATLKQGNQVIVSKALATDKRRVNINTLYTALFTDMPTTKDFKPPTQPEERERTLQELIRKINKPITLFIDEAHDLHWRTLRAANRELIQLYWWLGKAISEKQEHLGWGKSVVEQLAKDLQKTFAERSGFSV